MKKKVPFLILLVLLCFIIAFSIFRYFNGKTKFNDSSVNGNTAGNLYNNGLFCENGGVVFFANPSDSNTLYAMDSDGSNLRKLCDDTVLSINADANYVYYVRDNQEKNSGSAFSFLNINTNSLCRINRTGGDTIVILDSEYCTDAALIGNYLYYLRMEDGASSKSLCKIRIDGEDFSVVSDSAWVPSDADGQYFYFNGVGNDHNIWKMDTATDSTSVLYTGNCWQPTVVAGTDAYFMDCDNNYALTHVNLATGEAAALGTDRLDTYNLSGGYLYFQRSGDDAALCRIRTDGTGYEELLSGVYNSINITSSYLYVKEYNTGSILRTPADAPGTFELFAPGVAD